METSFVETSFIAPDIECGSCAASIEKALGRQDGVQTVDVATKRVTVAFDEARTDGKRIAATLMGIGFPLQER
ncbi:MAG: heavy-metal-associated domain-containing protein [Armatimonadota bacterium]|nr:heavy-metal-associated domain-containing protein [Armatimonadota bacterium]